MSKSLVGTELWSSINSVLIYDLNSKFTNFDDKKKYVFWILPYIWVYTVYVPSKVWSIIRVPSGKQYAELFEQKTR